MSQDITSEIKSGLESVENKFNEVINAKASEQVTLIKNIESELTKVSEQVAELEQKSVGFSNGAEEVQKSLGELFVNSASFQAFKSGQATKASLDIHNVLSSDATTPPQQLSEIGGNGISRRLRVRDVLGAGVTESNSVIFTKETLATIQPSAKADDTLFDASSITFAEVQAPVATIGTTLPISQAVMDDAPNLVSYINGRLMNSVDVALENQLIAGDGTGANIKGLLHADNHTAFTPQAGNKALDNIRRAMAVVESGEGVPFVVVLNPADASLLDLDVGTDEHFRRGFGTPIWGLQVVVTNAMPAGKFLVGDLAYGATYYDRQSAKTEISNSNGTDFAENMLTIRATVRGALAAYRSAVIVGGNLTA